MAYKNNNIETEHVQWNMNQAFLMRLDVRCNERDLAAIEGHILQWYRTLRTIYRNIHFKIKEKGHEEKEKKLDETFELIKKKLLSLRFTDDSQQHNSINLIEIDLDELDVQLNDLLHEYGFIYPEKENKSLEEDLEDDFKGEE